MESGDLKKRLIYQSNHRGCKETDWIFGAFCEVWIDRLSEVQLQEYDQLLQMPDVDLYRWFTGEQPVPEEVLRNSVWTLLKNMAIFTAQNA
jgi:antitoxin CptB